MQPLMNEKRHVSSFMPYRIVHGETEFYLQKRGENVRVLPNLFAMFGGGIEASETPEEACRREIREELNYTPKHLQYFTKYEAADAVIHVFIEEVGEDFESQVRVDEGEYGKFFKRKDIRGARKIALLVQLAAVQICHYLGTT